MSRLGQKDLAKRLGISQTTVSAVLNDNRSLKISESTRKRVRDEANRVNYWPNRAASALLSRKTRTIGVIHVGNYLQTHMQKLTHAAAAIREAGYTPVIQETVWGVEDDYICQYLRDAHVDGLLIVRGTVAFMREGFEKYLRGHIPVVILDEPAHAFLPRFNSNRRQGFRLLAEHLIGLGHRKIAVLVAARWGLSDYSLTHSFGVEYGALDALNAAGLEPVAVVRHQGGLPDRLDPYRGGCEAMRELLDSGKRPEAVVCSNDAWAIGAMTECLRRGMRIPDDIAFTGFHDEIQAQYAPSPLTTARTPIGPLIRAAVARLTEWLDEDGGPAIPASLALMDCELVVRESCGARLRANPGISAQKIQPA